MIPPSATPRPASTVALPVPTLALTVPAVALPASPTSKPPTPQPASTSPPAAPPANLIPPSAPRVYETSVTISTYGYEGALQASAPDDPIYPYPHLNADRVAGPAPKSYRAIVLENSYLQATILPELGGRLWRIVDKTTGRTVTYQNPVVKPTQWGYRGWWLGVGGIEWCLPVDEHGLNEYRAWKASVGPGASVTVSDHEDRTGLDVAVTIRLDNAHNYVIIEPRVTNLTGAPQQLQLWVNAMLALNGNRAGDSTRFILPASQVTVHSTSDDRLPGPHSKLEWPVAQGRDLSLYANWRGHLGLFASPAAQAGFAGVYDPSSDQGIVRAFPAGTARGVKFFGGKGIDPATWTDDGSTYVELWGGLTPTFWDYASIPAGQTWGWTERWYPVSGLGEGFQVANAAAALNLSATEVRLATSANLNAELWLWKDGQPAGHIPVTVGPGRTFVHKLDGSGVWGVQLIDGVGPAVIQAGNVP